MSFLKGLFQKPPREDAMVALQPPGVMFPWPCGMRLTALEPVILAIPAAAIADGEKIGSVIFGDADLEMHVPDKSNDSRIYLRLKAGTSVSLSKSVQAVVIADDTRPRKIKVRPASNETKA